MRTTSTKSRIQLTRKRVEIVETILIDLEKEFFNSGQRTAYTFVRYFRYNLRKRYGNY